MKSLTIILITFSALFKLNGQKSNAVYIELLGNGMITSINYDFAPVKNNENFRIKLGMPVNNFPSFIGQVNYLFGKGRHFLEFGIGTSVINFDGMNKRNYLVGFNGALQFRYEHPKGFLFRIGYAPIFFPSSDIDFLRYWPGLSLGYTF